jgi:maltose alpha-D-glucosyltransferase/alpha-amylase
MLKYWYQEAVIYELDVKIFQDSDGDGWGDFGGLTRRLPYIAGLGATCVWLRPFYPSPLEDDGYDVADYYAIDSRLGSFGDFVVFLREARNHGLRVIADLVVNHTSNQNPWFQTARHHRTSRYHDYYVWSRHKPKEQLGPVFPGPHDHETWTYDDVAREYYFHRFYSFQPDLDTANPVVREEISKIMNFWLTLGLSGFRVDATPFLLEEQPAGRPGEEMAFTKLRETSTDHPYALLRELRRTLSWCQAESVLLAEANVIADKINDYFGPGDDRMQMMFNFLLNQYLMLALARQQAAPLAEVFDKLPRVPPGAQWVTFLRNHDELDLSRLSEQERDEVYAAFAPDADMRVYNRGIRRRLAPMFGGDHRRCALAHSLLLSLPGTPMIRYGEEIGMGDDLSLPERIAVRTPMQWSPEPDAGFSTASADKLVRPIVSDGPFSYKTVNVAAQQLDPESLMNRITRLVRTRKNNSEFGRGRLTVLPGGDPAVFCHRCETETGAVMAVHNLAGHPVTADFDHVDTAGGEKLTDLLNERGDHLQPPGPKLELPAYGYRWFRVVGGKWSSR